MGALKKLFREVVDSYILLEKARVRRKTLPWITQEVCALMRSGDSQNPSWAWCAVRCSRRQSQREAVNVALTLHHLRAETLQFRQNPSFSSFSVDLHRFYSVAISVAIR